MPAAPTPATAVRYRDVAAAVDWLCRAFGFEQQTVMTSESGAIEYAQLTNGRAMLMLAPVRDTPLDNLMKQPDEIGGAATQSCYIVVDDADAHHARAMDAGAEVVLDLEDDDFGGRGYSCRDPEGHLWMFGTYDPWEGQFPEPAGAPAAAAPAADPVVAAPVRGGKGKVMLAGLAMTAVAVVAVVAWVGGFSWQPGAQGSAAVVQPAPVDKAAAAARERAEVAEQAVREAHAQLERERGARASADKAGTDAQKRIAEEQRARETAERGLREARVELERERAASKAAVDKASAGAFERAAIEQRARETEQRAREGAEKVAREARDELQRERAANKAAVDKASAGGSERAAVEQRAREAAEKAAKEARDELQRGRAAVTAAEVAKEFALTRADEERLAREAAERVIDEMREQLDRERAGKSGPSAPTDTDALKRVAKVQQALEAAQRQAAEAARAREAAEKEAQEAREQLAREQAAKAAAWKVVGQLTRQLKQVQGGAPSAEAGDAGGDTPAAKARRRPRKKAEPEEQQ
jgi:uncharacterized glyoxalase superfamily protein PhnB